MQIIDVSDYPSRANLKAMKKKIQKPGMMNKSSESAQIFRYMERNP